ncbi:hypothetical protein C9374_000765 [Naegleria lovaniensis]|uniref:Uncharacterized protein n=1 Tax=Naegleria lovaniensis TaxID=51637 RepID=A0AA88GVX2_NAELO|nr:uncharacterized protein C9374_000765 [Naegleria lovaniensis]KAG2387915.1 hypothetical protein C9374_000765 [Naegleria lovaniensis]
MRNNKWINRRSISNNIQSSSLLIILVFLATLGFALAGGMDEKVLQNGLTPAALNSRVVDSATTVFQAKEEDDALVMSSGGGRGTSHDTMMMEDDTSVMMNLMNFGSVLSEEESMKNTLNHGASTTTTTTTLDVSNMLSHLMEEDMESTSSSTLNLGEEAEEEAIAELESGSLNDSEMNEMMENLQQETGLMDAEIEQAASNAHEGFTLDEVLDSSGVSTLSTKSEQQLEHQRFLTRSQQHAKMNEFNCNPLCLKRKGFIGLVKKTSRTRALIKLLRKRRSLINKKLYPLQQLQIKARRTLEETKDPEQQAEAQHNKIKTEREISRLLRLKKMNNEKLKNALNNLKKLKARKAKAYLVLKKAITLHIAKLLKRYKSALSRKMSAVKVRKAQKEKFGKKKFIPPYLVNYAKLDVLIANKKYFNALYFLFKRQLFVLNHLIHHRSKVLNLLTFENGRAKLFALKSQQVKEDNEKLEKQLDATKSEVEKAKIKGQIEVNKLKLVQYKKHVATCTILIKRAQKALTSIANKLKEASKVLSSRKVDLPKDLRKLLQDKYNAEQAVVDKKRAINEAAVNKDELNAALPKPIDYSSKDYFILPLKKNNKPYVCTTNEKPDPKELLDGVSITKDVLFKPLICFHQSKIRVKVTYKIGQDTIFISKYHSTWIRQNMRLYLNKKGKLVVQKKGYKQLKKPASPAFKKRKVFSDRVKYIQTHPSTARAVIKSFVMKYYSLPAEDFSLSFSIGRGLAGKIKKSPRKIRTTNNPQPTNNQPRP